MQVQPVCWGEFETNLISLQCTKKILRRILSAAPKFSLTKNSFLKEIFKALLAKLPGIRPHYSQCSANKGSKKVVLPFTLWAKKCGTWPIRCLERFFSGNYGNQDFAVEASNFLHIWVEMNPFANNVRILRQTPSPPISLIKYECFNAPTKKLTINTQTPKLISREKTRKLIWLLLNNWYFSFETFLCDGWGGFSKLKSMRYYEEEKSDTSGDEVAFQHVGCFFLCYRCATFFTLYNVQCCCSASVPLQCTMAVPLCWRMKA